MAFVESKIDGESTETTLAQDSDSTYELDLNAADQPLKNGEAEEPAASRDEDLEKDQNGDILSKPTVENDESSVITLDEAGRQIGEKTLSALAEKFNGKLSGVRSMDAKDVLF